MKEYFKYANGYINVNDENLYLTNTGNWSEILELLEKSPKSIRNNSKKRNKIYLYYLIVIAIAGIFIFKFMQGYKIIKPLFVIAAIGFSVHSYMKRETGKRYKIPISKIKSIEIEETTAKIVFLNLNEQPDFETIKGIEEKGIKALLNLIEQLKT